MSEVLVIGSINMDLVTRVKTKPKSGETVMGIDFKTYFGGKGANQAVAAARLGADVSIIGCVADDFNGKQCCDNLKENGVSIDNMKHVTHQSTGIANITLADNDNSIIIVPGSNYDLTIDTIKENEDLILNSKVVVMQLEIPIDVVEYVTDFCKKNNIPTIVDPAPAENITQKIIENAAYLTPNIHEAKKIFNCDSIEDILVKYPNKLIVTDGDKGVKYYDNKKINCIPAIKAKVVDTTGAGDSFNGALAYALVNNYRLNEAIAFANKVGAISVTKLGAQSGMPYLKQVID